MNKIIYSNSAVLDRKIRLKHYIPYHIKKGEKYQERKKYFNYYWDMCFKVIYITHDRDQLLENICVRADNNTYHVLCSDLDIYDYLLIKDNEKIYTQDIINSNKSFTGAEIIYWFYVNNIDIEGSKYHGFQSYISNDSNFRLSDTNRYKIFAKLNKNGNYVNCKIKRGC